MIGLGPALPVIVFARGRGDAIPARTLTIGGYPITIGGFLILIGD